MPKVTETEMEIRRKYLKAPTVEEIKSFIKELKVTYSQFEVYYNIPPGTLKQVFIRARKLPVKYWPIIYERIIPTYGLKYTKKQAKIKKIKDTKRVNVKEVPDNVGRLNNL